MGFVLDKTKESNRGSVLAKLPENSEGDLILHFFSTFDNHEDIIVVEDVQQVGNWIVFDITDDLVPDRSGRYKVEFHTTSMGTIALNNLNEPFNTLESPINDLEAFRADVMFAQTVGEVINATNAFFKANNRQVVYKEQDRTENFKSFRRTEDYETYERNRTFKSQDRDVDYKTQY